MPSIATERAWDVLLAAAGRGEHVADGAALVPRTSDGHPHAHPDTPAETRDFLSLYLPLCRQDDWRVGHLGQSLDGCIATHLGESCFVTGPDNILHLHRMRALCDAVIVGVGTVISDDPQLTTRLVPGPNPVRVVLDPKGRLGERYRVFQDDAAPTLLCSGEGMAPRAAPGQADRLLLPADANGLRLDSLVAALAARGLRRLFIEGGGVTVSRFLAAELLSRLQIAVAPLVIGQGRPGLSVPRTERLADALRFAPRIFRMGADMLYDLDLSAAQEGHNPGLQAGSGLPGVDGLPVRVR